jgi:hypothetical protein
MDTDNIGAALLFVAIFIGVVIAAGLAILGIQWAQSTFGFFVPV